MENLIIERTTNSPKVIFNRDGNFLIEGRSIPDNAIRAFDPLFKWIDSFSSEKVKFFINLEYLNTSSSMQLYSLLKIIERNCDIKQIEVVWLYELDDEEHLETGEIFAEQLKRISFNFQTEFVN